VLIFTFLDKICVGHVSTIITCTTA
jgi:hypothetical protein